MSTPARCLPHIGTELPRTGAVPARPRTAPGSWGRHSCLPSAGGGRWFRIRDGDFHSSRRRLPHWHLDGATYFITFRLLHGELSSGEIAFVRDHIVRGDGQFYELIAVMVMPDHVHAALTPLAGYDLSRVTKRIKGVSARLLNERRGTRGAVWQDESWDRIVRDHRELARELDYLFDNPLRKRLTDNPWTRPGWWYRPQE